MPKNDLPIYKACINDDESGILVISLVENPAVEKDWLYFNENERPLQFSVQDEEKRIIRGLIMECDKLIYRRDETGAEFYITFDADTIRQMAQKFLKDGFQGNVDTMHNGQLESGVELVQWFISDKENGVNPKGFEEINDHSLFAEYKVLNDEIWAEVKNGTFRGFSLAGSFEPVRVELQKIKESKERKMTKLNSIKAMLQHILAQFARMSTDKGLLSYFDDELAIGTDVMIVDEDGKETKAPDGEYTNEDGVKYIIADGKVSEIIEPEIESVETEMEAEEPTVEPEAVEEPAVEEPVAEEPVAPEAVQETAENAETEPQVDPRDEQISTLQAENEELRNRIAELEAKLNEPAAEPIEKVFDNVTRVEKTGNKKLDNLIRVLNS